MGAVNLRLVFFAVDIIAVDKDVLRFWTVAFDAYIILQKLMTLKAPALHGSSNATPASCLKEVNQS